MAGVISVLAGLIEAIDDLPTYPFRPDLKKASDYLDRAAIPSEEVAADLLRIVVEGARTVRGFPFGADLDEAEAALAKRIAT